MKNTKWLVGLATVALLAGCAPSFNADSVIDGFADSVTGTITFAYNADYKVDVISEKGGMDSFKHDIHDVVTGEINLTAGDVYLHVKNEGKDGTVESTKEALICKGAEGYTYVTSTMENPKALADEAAALKKVNEVLKKVTYNLAGYVDLSTFKYSVDTYFWDQYAMGSTNITAEDYLDEGQPVLEGNDKGGLKATAELSYIGYNTDAGISDFPGSNGAPAATAVVNTNEKGYVTDYTETLNASLAMAIMNPAPIVTIKGTKTFSATYGEDLTKLETITHAKTLGTIEWTEPTGGTMIVRTGAEATEAACTKTLKSGDSVVLGEYVAIKVTPAGTNTIKQVGINNNSILDAEANKFYFFEIEDAKNKINLNFIGSDTNPETVIINATLTLGPGIELVEAVWFDQDNPMPMNPLEANELKAPKGDKNWFGFKVTVPEHHKAFIKSTPARGVFEMMGYLCIHANEEGDLAIEITSQLQYGVLDYDLAFAGGAAMFFQGSTKFGQDSAPLLSGTVLVENKFITVVPVMTYPNATIKSVKLINGSNTTEFESKQIEAQGHPTTAYSIKVAEGQNRVVIEYEGAGAMTEAKAAWKCKVGKDVNNEAVTVELKTFDMTQKGPDLDNAQPLENNGTVEQGKWVLVKVTAAEGFKVDSVKVNFHVLKSMGPAGSAFVIKGIGMYNIDIAASAVAA